MGGVRIKMETYKIKAYTIFILFILLIIPAVNAITPDFVFKNDGNASITLPCYYNGTWCGDSAECNISITNSNNKVLVNSNPMTHTGSLFNFSIPNFTTNGVYKASMVCLDQGLGGFYDFYFEINQLGSDDTTGNSLIILFLIFSFAMFIISLYLTVTIKSKTEFSDEGLVLKINYLKYLRIFAFFMIWLSAWWMSFFVWQASINYTQFTSLTSFLRMTFIIITSIGIPYFLITLAMLLAAILNNRELKKLMRRRLKPR